jgi:deoxyribonuclease V
MILELLRDDYTIEEAEALQVKYSQLLKEEEPIEFEIKEIDQFQRIAGVDVSYYERGEVEQGISCAVLWDLKSGEFLEKTVATDIINFPYKPGFLGFRECKLLSQAIDKLETKPDAIMCDGHGVIHPKRFGEAVQLGFALDIPSFGVAKKPFIGFFNLDLMGVSRGDKVPVLEGEPTKDLTTSKDFLGYVIRLRDKAKPVYISKGYRISLDLSVKISLETTLDHRQPEPLYLADKFSREKIKRV